MLFFWPLLVLPSSTLNCSLAAHSQSSSPWETFNSLAGEASGCQGVGAGRSGGAGAGDRDVGIVRAMGWLVSEGDDIPERRVLLSTILMARGR